MHAYFRTYLFAAMNMRTPVIYCQLQQQHIIEQVANMHVKAAIFLPISTSIIVPL